MINRLLRLQKLVRPSLALARCHQQGPAIVRGLNHNSGRFRHGKQRHTKKMAEAIIETNLVTFLQQLAEINAKYPIIKTVAVLLAKKLFLGAFYSIWLVDEPNSLIATIKKLLQKVKDLM